MKQCPKKLQDLKNFLNSNNLYILSYLWNFKTFQKTEPMPNKHMKLKLKTSGKKQKQKQIQ